MDKSTLKKKICDAIDLRAEDLIKIGRDIAETAELGYKEQKTSQYVKEYFRHLQLSCESGIGITGIKASLPGRSSRYRVAVLGELDAVKCGGHPKADPKTGAAHACGHNAQIAALLGTAMGLLYSGSREYLDGEVVFMAVPAEEFVELSYRKTLIRQGVITCCSGKQELISKGHFDDIDAAMMVHAHANTPQRKAYLNGSSNAFVAKEIRFQGKEAHAGGAPHEGINALNAAMTALMCIHAQRETFLDEDNIRIHPIITKGGDLVNIVPADVRMETYVRGRSLAAVQDAAHKTDRAVRGAAYAIGAAVEIENIPGYLPLKQNKAMSRLFRDNLLSFIPEEAITEGVDLIGSTDMGDLSALLPVIQPTMGGYQGAAHSEEFAIVDEEMAYIIPAKVMAMTVVDLLYAEAETLKDLKEAFVPDMTREQYINYLQNNEWEKKK